MKLRLPRAPVCLQRDEGLQRINPFAIRGKFASRAVAVVQKSSSIRRQSFARQRTAKSTATSPKHLWLLFTGSHACTYLLRRNRARLHEEKSRSQFMIAFSICDEARIARLLRAIFFCIERMAVNRKDKTKRAADAAKVEMQKKK